MECSRDRRAEFCPLWRSFHFGAPRVMLRASGVIKGNHVGSDDCGGGARPTGRPGFSVDARGEERARVRAGATPLPARAHPARRLHRGRRRRRRGADRLGAISHLRRRDRPAFDRRSLGRRDEDNDGPASPHRRPPGRRRICHQCGQGDPGRHEPDRSRSRRNRRRYRPRQSRHAASDRDVGTLRFRSRADRSVRGCAHEKQQLHHRPAKRSYRIQDGRIQLS